MTEERRWRIGELAKATGLTVRTLHHYEHIGLFAPTTRSEGSQRLYARSSLERLYRICVLRDLGLGLSEIARTIDDDPATLGDALHAHRARVEAELARLAQLRMVLDHACRSVERGEDPDILATLAAMTHVARHIASHGAPSGDVATDWRALGEALRACMDAGEPTGAATVQELACQIHARIVAFAAGDHATLDALAHLRMHAPPPELAGWDPTLMRYLDQALTHLNPATEDACATK